MTERLADVSARIEGIRQLGAVVNAMKGIAAARARSARGQIDAVASYAATISAAMASVLEPEDTVAPRTPAPDIAPARTGLLVFLAEQGFAGAFSDRVLGRIGEDLESANLFLIGTRGVGIAVARGLSPRWSAAMPSHTAGIPRLADEISKEIYRALDEGRIERLDVVHSGWTSGRAKVERHRLFPLDLSQLPPRAEERPLTQLPGTELVERLGAEYLHALVCRAALNAFAAENEARMEAMSSAGNQIESELQVFEATLRRVRQEEITAEIIELGTGAASAQGTR